jgi:hypothetical protein
MSHVAVLHITVCCTFTLSKFDLWQHNVAVSWVMINEHVWREGEILTPSRDRKETRVTTLIVTSSVTDYHSAGANKTTPPPIAGLIQHNFHAYVLRRVTWKREFKMMGKNAVITSFKIMWFKKSVQKWFGQGLVFQPITRCKIARIIIGQCSISTALLHQMSPVVYACEKLLHYYQV